MGFMKVAGGVAVVAAGAAIAGWAQRHSPRKGFIDNITTRVESYVLEKRTFHIALASAIVLAASGVALVIRGLTED